jgi:hypothetical protein
MKKVFARWIPSLLTPEQKLVRKEISHKNLIALQASDSFFFANCCRSVSLGLSYQTRINAVSPQRFASPKKIQNTIFLDEEGILRIEYMVKGTTINGEVYLKSIQSLKEA